MRTGGIGLVWVGLMIGAASAASAQSGTTQEPGAAATGAATSPTVPPASVAPTPPPSGPGQVQYSPPPPIPPAATQAQGALTPAEVRELLAAAVATARATRESVDYSRVTPDLLTAVLTKLDKIEDKLDKIENAIKASAPPPLPPRRR